METATGLSDSGAIVRLEKQIAPDSKEAFTPEALQFVAELQRRFNQTREELLQHRAERQIAFENGEMFDFLPETEAIRRGEWTVNRVPSELEKRWVEITGPVDRKMMINALNSGANGFMADFEDSLSPTWENVTRGRTIKTAVSSFSL